MIDTAELEDRLRRTYTAIADAVPEPDSDAPWGDDEPRPLSPVEDDRTATEGGGRHRVAVGAAAIMVVAIVVIGVVLTRVPAPLVDTVGPAESPDTSVTVAPTTVDPLPEGYVAVSVWASHREPIEGGHVDVWMWDDDGSIRGEDGTTMTWPSDGPGSGRWRPMYLSLPVVAADESRLDANGVRWTLLTFHVPPAAASWLAMVDGIIGVTVAAPIPSCVPFEPGCDEHQPPVFTLDSRAIDAPTTSTPTTLAVPSATLVRRISDPSALGGEALFPGILAVDAAGCVTMRGDLVMWPEGTRLEPNGAEVDVVLPSGDRATLNGDAVAIGGGVFPLANAQAIATEPIPAACATKSVIDAWSIEGMTTVDEMPP